MDMPIAFPARLDGDGLEIRINFGVFAGRDATPAELDDLAHELLPDLRTVSIVSEQRHEVSAGSEVSLHQVRIEVSRDDLPAGGDDLDTATERLVAAAERWARTCIDQRHAEIAEI